MKSTRKGGWKPTLSEAIQTAADQALPRCSIPGCGRPPEALQGTGLSRSLCRYHREFKARHGSAWKRSYTGADLKPYIAAAESYLKTHATDLYVAHALKSIEITLNSAGPVRRVNELPYLSLRDRARATFARLREGEVLPMRILSVAIGILAAVEEDPFKPRGHYPAVQIAKALRRRASGYHADYGEGRSFHRYPRSSGQVLIAVGEEMMKACEFVGQYHLPHILHLKKKRYGVLPLATEPASAPRSRHGDQRLKPSRKPSDMRAGTLSDDTSDEEAERIAAESRAAFAKHGFKAFDGKF